MLENLFASRVKPDEKSRLVGLFPETHYLDNISFGGGAPEEKLFPVEELKEAYQVAVKRQGAHAFQYHDIRGPEYLRQFLVERAKTLVGIPEVTDDEIMLTAGGQQGIELAAKLLLNKGDAMAVEAPTYVGALAAFDTFEPTYFNVSMEDDGADLTQFELLLKAHPEIKLFYTVPDFHNPTGITMSVAKRKRLVELANKYDFIILEDTPYRDLRYVGKSLPSVKSFDSEGRVIFLSSFSKILTPAFRLGWLVADPVVVQALTKLKLTEDLEVPYLPSATIEYYLQNNDLDEHIQSLRALYQTKMEAMMAATDRYLPGIKVSHPEGGFFLWLELDQGIDTTKLLWENAVPEQHLVYVPSESFYVHRDRKNGMRINFTGPTYEQIDDGVKRLSKMLVENSRQKEIFVKAI